MQAYIETVWGCVFLEPEIMKCHNVYNGLEFNMKCPYIEKETIPHAQPK